MLLYALTIFASAFLLFLVQPIIAKEILPWFGGSAAVWTTCLVFFQTALLAGYAYADAIVRKLSPRAQTMLHVALLVVSFAALPIIPAEYWKPYGSANPAWRILGLLAVTIGLPYLMLSATSPLLQAWFARRYPGARPYRLFALSNFASMLALIGYPFVVEPWLPTKMQAWVWSAAYALFAGLCAATALVTLRDVPAAAAVAEQASTGDEAPPTLARQLLWVALAATGSVLLLAVTNHITQNIAAVPLLWIVPLGLYLVTFIIAFDGPRWYARDLLLPAVAAALGIMAWTLANYDLTFELTLQIGVFTVGLFLGCMFCHGELARLKPEPRYLTRFYLMVALGGAFGSTLVGIVAPLVLTSHVELAIGIVVCAALLTWQVRRDSMIFRILGVAASLATIGFGIASVREFYDGVIRSTRNFYGVLRVQEYGVNTITHSRSLIHGTIMHGRQFFEPQWRRRPTTYYVPTSGIGRVLESLNPRLEPLRVGVIGLGTGTIAAYGAAGDVYRFYDINPGVVRIAYEDFRYLSDSEAKIEIVLGDARLSLEREAPQNFDVLAIDAFSSDAIPVHLITSEALSVYERHIAKGGVIAFHVTNRYLNLIPVVEALATKHAFPVVLINDETNDSLASRSDWVLLSRNTELLAKPLIATAATPIQARPDWRLWTDDFNNLVQVLK
jgi:hypothetical protein